MKITQLDYKASSTCLAPQFTGIACIATLPPQPEPSASSACNPLYEDMYMSTTVIRGISRVIDTCHSHVPANKQQRVAEVAHLR